MQILLVARMQLSDDKHQPSVYFYNTGVFFHSQYYKDLQACRHERDILRHSFLEGRVCNSGVGGATGESSLLSK